MQKYKVFLNGKSIIFDARGKVTFTKLKHKYPNFADVQDVISWLGSVENSGETEFPIKSENPEQDFHRFQNAMIVIQAAGGIITRKESLLFIFRNNKWDLPKGKIDEGETPEAAALREVEEECGIHGHRIIRSLQPGYHIYRSPYKKSLGKWIFKKTHWFEMAYEGTGDGIPQTEEGITEIRWFNRNDLNEVMNNTYENLKELLCYYFD